MGRQSHQACLFSASHAQGSEHFRALAPKVSWHQQYLLRDSSLYLEWELEERWNRPRVAEADLDRGLDTRSSSLL